MPPAGKCGRWRGGPGRRCGRCAIGGAAAPAPAHWPPRPAPPRVRGGKAGPAGAGRSGEGWTNAVSPGDCCRWVGGSALHILANTRTLAAQQAADNDPPPHTCSSEGPPLAASPSSSSTSSCGVVCGAANAASASASCCTACASHAAMPAGGRDGWQGTLQAWRARCGLVAARIQAQISLGEHLELTRRFRRPAQACNNPIPPGGCTKKRSRLAASKGPRCRSSQGTALGRRSCRGGGPSRKVAGAVHQLGVL